MSAQGFDIITWNILRYSALLIYGMMAEIAQLLLFAVVFFAPEKRSRSVLLLLVTIMIFGVANFLDWFWFGRIGIDLKVCFASGIAVACSLLNHW